MKSTILPGDVSLHGYRFRCPDKPWPVLLLALMRETDDPSVRGVEVGLLGLHGIVLLPTPDQRRIRREFRKGVREIRASIREVERGGTGDAR